jgi:uridine kinase
MVLAVDGRSSSGKTTLAAQVQTAVAGSAVIHTDDLAWWHSRFGWADLLIEGILMPAHQGQPVSFRPPSWAEHGRAGSIDVPADCPLLIIEGVGAGRREATRLVDALIWVQSDQAEAERRSLARVGQTGGPRTVQNLREWMAEEEPFLAEQRPWERADLVVAGTPQIPFDPLTELVVAQRQPGTTKT